MNRAVFLDRDGVLNRVLLRENRPLAPTTVDHVELLPGVEEALQALHASGFQLVVVTNQPDVANGVQRREGVEAIHRMMRDRLPLDDILTCYHNDGDACDCRKPKPGMLLTAARERGIDLAASYMVGDRWRDVAAGQAAGCTTIWVRSEYAEQAPENPDIVVDSLREASMRILERERDPVEKQEVA